MIVALQVVGLGAPIGLVGLWLLWIGRVLRLLGIGRLLRIGRLLGIGRLIWLWLVGI